MWLVDYNAHPGRLTRLNEGRVPASVRRRYLLASTGFVEVTAGTTISLDGCLEPLNLCQRN